MAGYVPAACLYTKGAVQRWAAFSCHKGGGAVAKPTEKQKRFADEYLIDLNATRAYMTAYPSVKSENSAAVCASKLIRNAKVAAYIAQRQQERVDRAEITQDEVLEALASMGLAEVDIDAIKPSDKIKALELLMKHMGMFEPRNDVDGGVQIIDDC